MQNQRAKMNTLCQQPAANCARCHKGALLWSPAHNASLAPCVPRETCSMSEAPSPLPAPVLGILTLVWSQPVLNARLRHTYPSPSSLGKCIRLGTRACLQVELFLNSHSDQNPFSKNGLFQNSLICVGCIWTDCSWTGCAARS